MHSSKPEILHGDMKARNVLIDSRFRDESNKAWNWCAPLSFLATSSAHLSCCPRTTAKLCDFGLSTKKDSRITGTPFWLAPGKQSREWVRLCPSSSLYLLTSLAPPRTTEYLRGQVGRLASLTQFCGLYPYTIIFFGRPNILPCVTSIPSESSFTRFMLAKIHTKYVAISYSKQRFNDFFAHHLPSSSNNSREKTSARPFARCATDEPTSALLYLPLARPSLRIL